MADRTTNAAIGGVVLLGLSARLVERSTQRSVKASWARNLHRGLHSAIRGVARVAATVAGVTGMVLLIYAFLGNQVDELRGLDRKS